VIEERDVTEPLEIGESLCILREDLDTPLDPTTEARLDRNPIRLSKRGMDDPDRVIVNRFYLCHSDIIS
jgi:hypothetical protein